MAKLYITEYSTTPTFIGQSIPTGVEPAPTQVVAIGPTSTESAPFAAYTKFVRVHCDVTCSIEFGIAPDADTDNLRMAANTTEFFGVEPGHILSVIENT